MIPAGVISPARAFTPADIADLELWLSADAGLTLAGSNVAVWADISGKGRDLDEATNRPTFQASVINSRPVVRFDGSNDKLYRTFSLTRPFTVLCVHKNIAYSSLSSVWYAGNVLAGTTPMRLVQISSGDALRLDGNSVSGPSVTSNLVNAQLTESYVNGAATTLRKNNGSAVLTGSSMGTINLTGFCLGGRISDRFANVDVAEVIILNRALTGTERTNLQTYFNSRYALW